MGLELEADFHLGVALGEKLDAIHGLLDKRVPHPNYFTFARSAFAAAPGAFPLDYGTPPVNKIWNIVSMVGYQFSDSGVDANGNLALYVGEDAASISLGMLVAVVHGLPASTTFTKDVLWCYSGQHPIINITTGSSGVQVGANVVIQEWDLTDKW